jgi:hypothetical protein
LSPFTFLSADSGLEIIPPLTRFFALGIPNRKPPDTLAGMRISGWRRLHPHAFQCPEMAHRDNDNRIILDCMMSFVRLRTGASDSVTNEKRKRAGVKEKFPGSFWVM